MTVLAGQGRLATRPKIPNATQHGAGRSRSSPHTEISNASQSMIPGISCGLTQTPTTPLRRPQTCQSSCPTARALAETEQARPSTINTDFIRIVGVARNNIQSDRSLQTFERSQASERRRSGSRPDQRCWNLITARASRRSTAISARDLEDGRSAAAPARLPAVEHALPARGMPPTLIDDLIPKSTPLYMWNFGGYQQSNALRDREQAHPRRPHRQRVQAHPHPRGGPRRQVGQPVRAAAQKRTRHDDAPR